MNRKLRLLALFSGGFFLIAVSVVRIVQGIPNARIQQSRTMWASIETIFATVVAQAPSTYSLLRPRAKGSSYGPSYDISAAANSQRKTQRSHLGSTFEMSNGGFKDKSYRAEGYAEMPEGQDTIHFGENDSTKGILVETTTTVQQELRSGDSESQNIGNRTKATTATSMV